MLVELAVISGVGYLIHQKKQPAIKKSTSASSNQAPTQQVLFRKPQRILTEFRKALAADGRQKLQVDIDPKLLDAIEATRQQNDQRMKFALGATGLALLGSAFPIFYLLGTAGVLYLSRRMFQRAAKDFKLKHYLSTNLMGLVMTMGMLFSGHLLLAALAGVMGSFFAKIIDRVEDGAQQQLITTFVSHPEKVWVLKAGTELQVNFELVQIGDIVVVNAGEVIPVDGTIQSGIASIDQHILTGESQPVEKAVGEQVFASTLLLSGNIHIVVETAGKDSVSAKIGQVLNYTQSYKDTLITRGRKISDRFIPLTAGLSLVTLPTLGVNAATAVLWSGTGATMGILGPLSVLIYSQILARQGILIKDGRTLESLREVSTIVFDKTGTLTLEQPTVARVHSVSEHDETTILRYAAAAEYRQPHPIAKAILAAASTQQLTLPELATASYQVGYGIRVVVDDHVIHVGSARFLQMENIAVPEQAQPIQAAAEIESHSLIYVSIDQTLAGMLEMQPTLRPEAPEVVQYLKQRGFKLVIISGDHEAPTRRMAETLGIEQYFAETLPEHKADIVKQLREQGEFVCFIGDGINDAIALKAAQLSISMRGASTIATDTAQIIFMDGTLIQLSQLFDVMDEFEQTMQTNFLTSISPGIVSIGGIFFFHFGIAAAMGLTYLGCFAGLGNSLLPLAKYHDETLDEIVNNTPSVDTQLSHIHNDD